MAVQRRVNWISQQEVQVPDMRMIESAASNDWDQFVQAAITSTTQGYIIRGFNILMANAIGGAASNLQMQVDPGAVMHILASQSGTILMVPVGTPPQQLNSVTNSNVTGSFSPNSINYVTVDYTRFLDDTTDAQVYIWDPTSQTTTTVNAPRANILTYVINISTSTPTSNQLPIAAVLTDSGNNVLSVSDERWLLFRLGTGGTNPNPFYTYPWPESRTENPFTSTSNSIDPFSGGDKALLDWKDWMNAVMSSIGEIKGTPYWYSLVGGGPASDSLVLLREDLGNTLITGDGIISQGILPKAVPVLVTTGTASALSNQLTLASVAGIVDGDYIFYAGLPALTTVLDINGSVVTMSAQSLINVSNVSVSFYAPESVTAPGQINWNEPIFIDVVGSALSYELAANISDNYITLADDQVAYISLIRSQAITPNLIFTNGSQIVTSVGLVSWTASLLAGDYVKLVSSIDAGYYKIQSVDSTTQVTLVEAFAETSTGAAGAQASYAYGSYSAVASPSGNARAIQIANREDVPTSPDTFWLFAREDNGGAAKVYVKLLGSLLENGDSQSVGGDVPNQLLEYIGSPSLVASKPQYVAALDPGSITQITSISTGPGIGMTGGRYFLIYSSANARTYAVWTNVDGTGTQPNVPYANEYLEWVTITGDTPTNTASKLAILLNGTLNRDFSASSSGNVVTVTNQSAGTCNDAVNFNVNGAFSISVTQNGTGQGNHNIQDGDNLTLAIKELDGSIGAIETVLNEPNYEETVTVVASGQTPPTTLNGPIAAFTNITLPNNTRASNTAQYYVVNSAKLDVFLNGQELIIGDDYSEVGTVGAFSNQIETLIGLVVGDILEFRIGIGGGGGLGGPEGPTGPVGPVGPPGSDAIGGPISVSTKTSSYTVLSTDNVLLADCTSGAIIFSLPPAATATGRVFYFKKTDASLNQMSIQANGGDLIDGVSSQSTTVRYYSFMLITDGTSWWSL